MTLAIEANRPKSRPWPVMIIVAIVLLIAVAVAAWLIPWRGGAAAAISADATLYTIVPMDLDVRVNKDGELQSINSIDLACEVEGRSTITYLVKEGASVKKGDMLVELDSSTIRQKIEDATLDVQKAEADLANAIELREIQVSNNAADLEGATVALKLAELDLREYSEGTYPKDEADARTKLDMTRINEATKANELDQAKALFSKGFVTAAEVTKMENGLTEARNAVSAAKNDYDVLTKYTYEKQMATRRNALVQAQSKLERTKRLNASQLAQKVTDVRSKTQTLTSKQQQLDHLQEQLAACTIYAPADGMVVYSSTVDRNQQNAIQEGSEVRERQELIRLPDTHSMKVVVRINESQVSRLKEGQRAMVNISGYPDPIFATLTRISVLPDSGNRWLNPDSKEYPVDLTLDWTPEGAKPGVSARCEIYIDQIDNTLAVPLQAIYSAGRMSYVFVPKGEGFEPRAVKLGKMNSSHVQVVDGVKENDRVLMLQAGQGRELLQKAGIEVPAEPTRRGPGDAKGRPGGPGAAPGNGAPGTGAPASATPAAGAATPAGGNGQQGERRRRPEGTATPQGASTDASGTKDAAPKAAGAAKDPGVASGKDTASPGTAETPAKPAAATN